MLDGLGDHTGQREPQPAVVPVVADHAVLPLEPGRHGIRVSGETFRRRPGGRGQDLLDRPGLVDVEERAHAEVARRREHRLVGVEGRVVGEREHLAGAAVERPRRRLSAGALDGLAQRAGCTTARRGRWSADRAVLRRHDAVVAGRQLLPAAHLVRRRAVLARQQSSKISSKPASGSPSVPMNPSSSRPRPWRGRRTGSRSVRSRRSLVLDLGDHGARLVAGARR
jgi:hypothetical protein